jgi:hypothetical protein
MSELEDKCADATSLMTLADCRLDSFEKIWTDLVPGFTVQELYRLSKEIGTHHVVELARATLQAQGYVRCREPSSVTSEAHFCRELNLSPHDRRART